MTRVLVCDDEPQILRAVRVILRDAGYEVDPTASVAEALEHASEHPPDAAILDLVLPDGSGVDICTAMRSWTQVPILVLSAVGDEDAKVKALTAGADDYITKPFGARELVARLRAALRRGPLEADSPLIETGDLVIDLAARRVTRGTEQLRLTPTEYDLLARLLRHRGRVLTHHTLLVDLWGPGAAGDVDVLRTHVANLRRKIGPQHIRTDPGIGYRFTD